MTNQLSDGQLIDVRTALEYRAGHIDGALNLSVQDIAKGKMPDLDKQEKIYLYCRSGGRADTAVSLLTSAGFTDVKNVGGMADVQVMGGVVKR